MQKTINDRIALLIDELHITKTAFASKLKVTQPYISKLIKKGNPSDMLIEDICHKFNVSEDWLRHGIGNMFIDLADMQDEYTLAVNQIDADDPMAKQAILAYWKLSPEDKELFWKFMERFKQEKKED